LIEETEFWWLGFLEGEMTLISIVDLEAPDQKEKQMSQIRFMNAADPIGLMKTMGHACHFRGCF
jgi:Na+-transporting NADH:ubiquinone oxidoreductase subunit NqrB